MTKGDIVIGEGNTNATYPKNGHPIVFIKENDPDTFIGLMLSTKSYRGMNRKMEAVHFEALDENEVEFEFKYNNTHVVPLNLLKKTEWKPFRRIGQLTPEGLLYVEEVIAGTEPVYWVDAVKANH